MAGMIEKKRKTLSGASRSTGGKTGNGGLVSLRNAIQPVDKSKLKSIRSAKPPVDKSTLTSIKSVKQPVDKSKLTSIRSVNSTASTKGARGAKNPSYSKNRSLVPIKKKEY